MYSLLHTCYGIFSITHAVKTFGAGEFQRIRLFGLKDWSRIALRRDKTYQSWMGFAYLPLS